MDIKTRYVEEMAARRRSGNPEISFLEFSHILNQATLQEKWSRNIHRMGRLMFRKAGLMIGEEQYISGSYNLIGACLLAPNLTFGKLLDLYQNKT